MPAATKDGDKVKISFTVSAPTDVEVAVVNPEGKVMRHLAAGVLGGEKPPPEPLTPGLVQELGWDGKDDLGKAVPPEGCRVRVRSGMKAELDGFIGESPYWVGELHGLATDPQGNLYVYSSSVPEHYGSSRYLQVFDRQGNYLRTIMPMPANLPPDKLKAYQVIPTADGTFHPRNFFGTWPELYPGKVGSLVPSVTADGVVTISDGFNVACIKADGTSDDDQFFRPLWQGAAQKPSTYGVIGPRHVAASPDGKSLYLTGFCYPLHLGKSPDLKVHPDFPDGRVYRFDRSRPRDGMQKFVDLPLPENVRQFCEVKEGYRAQDYYTATHSGVGRSACDKDGSLVVCDRINGMVRVFRPDGKEIGGFAVDSPENVAVHSRSGVVYVSTSKYSAGKGARKKLLKFSSYRGDATLLAEYTLPRENGYSMRLALDDSAHPPVVWVAGDMVGRRCLLRMEDRGDRFEITRDLMDLNKDRFGVKPRLAVHPETELVICNDGAATLNGYNGLTGERVKLPSEYGADMAVGLDGNWYIQLGRQTDYSAWPSYSGYICRFDKDLKPIPVRDPPTGGYGGRAAARPGEKPIPNALGFVYGRMGAGFCTVGMAPDPRGRVYSMQMYGWALYCVAAYGPDGHPEDPGRLKDDPLMMKAGRFASALVGPIETRRGGIQLDCRGNIYIGLGVVPTGHTPPPGFEKDPAYQTCVGSVVKFKPEGGAVVALKGKDAELPADKQGLVMDQRSYRRGPRFLENAVMAYPGLGCMAGGLGDGCECRQPMFQVDSYGRIFYPNAITCSVRVVDNAGNEILSFGKYGNIDSAGPKSMIPQPGIPLGWPEAVGVSHTAIYVSDVLNRRIVRLIKKYAAEGTCPVE
jgi:hypothetical protein